MGRYAPYWNDLLFIFIICIFCSMCFLLEETVAKPMSRGDVSVTRLSCSFTFNVSPKIESRPLCGCFYTFKFGRKLHNGTNCTWVAVIDPKGWPQCSLPTAENFLNFMQCLDSDKIMLWYPWRVDNPSYVGPLICTWVDCPLIDGWTEMVLK